MNPKELEAAGINFTVNALDCASFFDISADEIPAYVADSVGWYATAYGVSREQVEAYQRLVDSVYRCTALTRRGTRCSNEVEGRWHLAVGSFQPELDGFCRRHRAKVQAA